MTTSTKQDYMLMMRGSYAAWDSYSPEERQAIMERYYAFVRRLRDEGRFKGGSALDGSLRRLLTADTGTTRVLDGPHAESKEALNGYFLVEAKDLDEAVALARDCPCLTHGETVEVIALGKHG